MAFISLEINIGTKAEPDWQLATLKDDVSINIENVSAIWDTDNGGGAFSYEFELPVEENLNILGNSCDMRGVSIYKQLYGKKFRLYCGGLCMFYGIVKMDDTMEIEEDEYGNHSVGISLNADNYEWEDLLEGVNARDVELAELDESGKLITEGKSDKYNRNIQIGYSVPVTQNVQIPVTSYYHKATEDKWETLKGVVNTTFYIPQLLVTNYKTNNAEYGRYVKDFTNVQVPYDNTHPYCNATICYQHYELGDSDSEKFKKVRGYNVGKHDRINSAPCFYVLFWFDLLMDSLGIDVKKNTLTEHGDIKRLAFYHTDCHYVEDIASTNKPRLDDMYITKDFKDCTLSNLEASQDGSTRTNPSNLSLVFALKPGKNNAAYLYPYNNTVLLPNKSGDKDKIEGADVVYVMIAGRTDINDRQAWVDAEWQYTHPLGSNENQVGEAIKKEIFLNPAYATAENFPNVDAKEVLEGIQNAFCARYLYNANNGTLQVVLVKDVLSQDTCTSIACDIHKVTKTENHVTGFRLKYSATEDAATNSITLKEDLTGTVRGTEGSDTTFSYNDYTKVVLIDGAYKKNYGWLLNNVSPYDKNCYVSVVTGDAFRIKVDGDAESGEALNPALFQVGQGQKAEWGNCSATRDNKDFIQEVTIGFTPLVENDVNSAAEKYAQGKDTYQILASLVDGEICSYTNLYSTAGDMTKDGNLINASTYYDVPIFDMDAYLDKDESENTEGKGKHSMCTVTSEFYIDMKGIEVWDLKEEEPTQSNDSGFTLGIMRGSGSAAHYNEFDKNYDKETNNSKWDVNAGNTPTFTMDSIDVYGRYWDYNGSSIISYESTNPEAVPSVLTSLFPYAHADIASEQRNSTTPYGSQIYKVEGSTNFYVTKYNSSQFGDYYKDDDGNQVDVDPKYLTLVTNSTYQNRYMYSAPAKTYGYVLYVTMTDAGNESSNVNTYKNDLLRYAIVGKDLWNIRKDLKLYVGSYQTEAEAQAYQSLLEQLGTIYYTGVAAKVDVPSGYESIFTNVSYGDNGIGYETKDAISLRIKAEKKNPYYGDKSRLASNNNLRFPNGSLIPNTEYFPISSICAKRGLADKFYSEYAHWVLNRRIANIECTMELADLINIDMTKKYRIGEYEGFIKQLSYTIDNESGLSPVEIEFYYL